MPNGRESLFGEHEGNKAIGHNNWKAVCKHLQKWEFYDLDSDRTESNDLSANLPSNQYEIFLKMLEEYYQWKKRVGVFSEFSNL